MVDHVNSFGWKFDFTTMLIELPCGSPVQLEIRDSEIGWIGLHKNWYRASDIIQAVYSEWLDRQIYGDSNG